MELLADPEASLGKRAEIQRFVEAGDGVRALATSLKGYEDLSGRAVLEWDLASLLIRTGATVPDPSAAWPPDLLERPSGAALAFVVSQRRGTDLALPGGLARLVPVRRAHKEVLATAWRLRPEQPGLGDPVFRSRFAVWLSAAPAAIGDCLLAAAAIGDRELVGRLGPIWVREGLFHPGAPAQVEDASRAAGLETFAREAVRTAVGLFFQDRPSLLRLLDAAFHLGDFDSVAALGQALLGRGDLDEAERPKILALALVSLAELDRHEEVVEAYRARWMPASWPFPHPERLLYVFQQRGEADLEKHLLETARMTEETPGWVLLCRDLARNGQPRRADMEAWGALYAESPRDERVLVGATGAALRGPPLLKEEWTERLGLRARWRSLAGLDGYRYLAGAFLVLLQATDAELVEEFEARLQGAPLSLEPVRRAARSYVAALRRGRRWDRLRALSAAVPDLFDLACPFREREMARVMAALGEIPRNEVDLRSWCAGWERLLSLPLSGAEVLEVLDEFLTLRRELERRLPAAAGDERLGDVALQVLRRAKAEAETAAARAAGDQEAFAETRRRIRQGGLEAMARILQESNPISNMEGHPDA
ncbi:MAG TPA: hypothetical protein VE685_05305 [Thermoanaerobaculia bacterium]|nr:hypothetical protein [Thermoanaerobaculia bacterium]